MEQAFEENHLRELSRVLDTWESIAKNLRIPESDISGIKSLGNEDEKVDRMLECWKQMRGSWATYEEMARTLLKINRTDLAEKMASLRCSHIETKTRCLIQTLRNLEKWFYKLMTFVEYTLKKRQIRIDTITRRFSMLPKDIKLLQKTDKHFRKTRRRIVSSTTAKELFDNLTELKHWSFMMPDTLSHIVQDVKFCAIHQKIDEYKKKLSTFKTNTKLRDLIDTDFPVPDYCMELTVEVEGWEDKTIEQAEKIIVKLRHKATYARPVSQ